MHTPPQRYSMEVFKPSMLEAETNSRDCFWVVPGNLHTNETTVTASEKNTKTTTICRMPTVRIWHTHTTVRAPCDWQGSGMNPFWQTSLNRAIENRTFSNESRLKSSRNVLRDTGSNATPSVGVGAAAAAAAEPANLRPLLASSNHQSK